MCSVELWPLAWLKIAARFNLFRAVLAAVKSLDCIMASLVTPGDRDILKKAGIQVQADEGVEPE